MRDDLLARYGGRPFLVALAVLNAITGLAAIVVLAPLSFGADVDFLRRGAQGLMDGVPVADFVFTPLCALVAVPLALLPAPAAAAVMLGVELAVLLALVAIETRAFETVDRLLIAVAVALAVPIVNELLLGQVTILIAAGVYPLRDADGWRRGIGLGLVLALVPKPLLLPLIPWLLLRRRRGLASALALAGALTLLAVLVLGPAAYGDWFDALRGAGDVTRQGNLSVWSSGVTPLAIALAAAILVAYAVSLREDRPGFVAALATGVLLAPYSLTYALSILGLAVRPALAVMPIRARLLAITVNPAVILVPAAWTLGWLTIVAHRSTPPGSPGSAGPELPPRA